MSKERELLNRSRYNLDREYCADLIDEIQELLAQPEPFKPDWANYRQGVADSKREPLSESEIAFIWGDSDYDVAVVRRIEKAHGVE